MDRGRKAMPVANRVCNERYIKKSQARHRQKLRDMRSSIDNKSPRQATHLKTKAKKNALMEDRFAQIESENRLLLEKMSHIMRYKGGIDNENDSHRYAHSLNKERRKRELQRVTKQNQQILKRIQESQPTYDHIQWAEEAQASDRILANICEFKGRSFDDESDEGQLMIMDDDGMEGYYNNSDLYS
mmetsp:Transcript_36549/g.44106  ORF Transcript_36549/g.44106 Transcript_36549/m.44106 type:complete len:186 (-) Transcript_36549:61-618(-)